MRVRAAYTELHCHTSSARFCAPVNTQGRLVPLLTLAFSALFQHCVSQGLVKENGQLVGGPLSSRCIFVRAPDAARRRRAGPHRTRVQFVLTPACSLNHLLSITAW